jgi:hypothetical protein
MVQSAKIQFGSKLSITVSCKVKLRLLKLIIDNSEKMLPMPRFEPWISVIQSQHANHCGTDGPPSHYSYLTYTHIFCASVMNRYVFLKN